MAAAMQCVNESNCTATGNTRSATNCDGERDEPVAFREQNGAEGTGCAQNIDKQRGDPPFGSLNSPTKMKSAPENEDNIEMTPDGNPGPAGPPINIGHHSIGNHSCDFHSDTTCPLCIGILERLDFDLKEEPTPQNYWADLPTVEPGSVWKLSPKPSCHSLRAILNSCEHLHEQYGLDIELPECIAMREVAMFRHLEEVFPKQYKNRKFDLGKWPAIGVKAAAKYSIGAIMNKGSGKLFYGGWSYTPVNVEKGCSSAF